MEVEHLLIKALNPIMVSISGIPAADWDGLDPFGNPRRLGAPDPTEQLANHRISRGLVPSCIAAQIGSKSRFVPRLSENGIAVQVHISTMLSGSMEKMIDPFEEQNATASEVPEWFLGNRRFSPRMSNAEGRLW